MWIFFLVLTLSKGSSAQSASVEFMFYNTENYFDPFNDSLTLDDEFTPEGAKHWTWKRFQQKANHLYKVFMAAGDWDPPDVIGLAEVENAYVLHYLTKETPFAKFDYGVVHYESPDRRGIDVALIYRKEHVRILDSKAFPVTFSHHPEKKTRDILYVLLSKGSDTLACLVNHWPSRWGGYLESEPYRLQAARELRRIIDSIKNVNLNRIFFFFFFFNDEPSDPSLLSLTREDQKESLINLMGPLYKEKKGTLFYNHRWWLFDQFIISKNLLRVVRDVRILKPAFLLDKDAGYIPFRTYSGMRYKGGFSDHLPVLLDMQFK